LPGSPGSLNVPPVRPRKRLWTASHSLRWPAQRSFQGAMQGAPRRSWLVHGQAPPCRGSPEKIAALRVDSQPGDLAPPWPVWGSAHAGWSKPPAHPDSGPVRAVGDRK